MFKSMMVNRNKVLNAEAMEEMAGDSEEVAAAKIDKDRKAKLLKKAEQDRRIVQMEEAANSAKIEKEKQK